MNNVLSVGIDGFRLAALYALGDQTLYRSAVSLTVDEIHETVSRKLLPLPARTPDVTLNRNMRQLAAYEFRHTHQKTEVGLVYLQLEGLVTPTKGGWTLTAQGIASSIKIRAHFTSKNVTSRWCEGVVDKNYMSGLITHMSRKCKLSVSYNEIHDLVHTFFANLIGRDGLRARLSTGRFPSPSDIRSWVYNSALSQWRNEGRDALTRSFKGSRTEKDLQIQAGKVDDDIAALSMPSNHRPISLADSESAEADGALLDLSGGDLSEEISHRIYARQRIAQVQALIQGPKQEREEVFSMTLQGRDTKQIADDLGLTRVRVSSLLSDLRTASSMPSASPLAAQVLLLVQNEPYTTYQELAEELGSTAEYGCLFTESFMAGLVAEGKVLASVRRGVTSYRVTRVGEALLSRAKDYCSQESYV